MGAVAGEVAAGRGEVGGSRSAEASALKTAATRGGGAVLVAVSLLRHNLSQAHDELLALGFGIGKATYGDVVIVVRT